MQPTFPRAWPARFIDKISVDPQTGCWNWTASRFRSGYGAFKWQRRMRVAHLVGWEILNGEVEAGMQLDHRCSNAACVNLGHLRVTTPSQNQEHRAGATRRSRSGVRGVSWHPKTRKWRVIVWSQGRAHSGGLHETIEAADLAARTLRAEVMTHAD